ncbi:Propanediol utilization polyhedral body protein PduB, partial [Salmonella enterica subsp. enterica serovar Adelaide str. A4-669]
RACGVIVGAPASVGVLMADTALKSANVEVVAYSSPAHGTSFSNEAILVISGDSGAVRQAVTSAREIGKTVLATLGSEPVLNRKTIARPSVLNRKTIARPTSDTHEADS